MSNPFDYEDDTPDDFWGDSNPFANDEGTLPDWEMDDDDLDFGLPEVRPEDRAAWDQKLKDAHLAFPTDDSGYDDVLQPSSLLGPQWRQQTIHRFPGEWHDFSPKQATQEANYVKAEHEVGPRTPMQAQLDDVIDAKWELDNAERAAQTHVNEASAPLINEAFTPTLFDQPDLRALQLKRMLDPRIS